MKKKEKLLWSDPFKLYQKLKKLKKKKKKRKF